MKIIMFFLLVVVGTLSYAPQLSAQQSAQAVMRVQVEVIEGTQISNDLITDITLSNDLEINSDECIKLGNYTLNIPEGTDFTTSVNGLFTFVDGKDNIYMETEISSTTISDGAYIIEVEGVVNTDYRASEVHAGTMPVAVVEYF